MSYPETEGATIGDTPPIGGVEKICVECEFALSAYSTMDHKRSCELFRQKGKPLQEFEETMY
jgi:hypothetical protein